MMTTIRKMFSVDGHELPEVLWDTFGYRVVTLELDERGTILSKVEALRDGEPPEPLFDPADGQPGGES